LAHFTPLQWRVFLRGHAAACAIFGITSSVRQLKRIFGHNNDTLIDHMQRLSALFGALTA
jgi:hypothetical protein